MAPDGIVPALPICCQAGRFGPPFAFPHCLAPDGALERIETGKLMTLKSLGMARWLRIFCAALLLSLGLAHKPVLARAAPVASTGSYMLPDGSYASICYNGQTAHPEKAGWQGCEACRLGGDLVVPAPSSEHVLLRQRGERVMARQTTAFAARPVSSPGSPVRGPPLAFA